MKQRKINLLFILLFISFVTSAQHVGFSKLYRYDNDTSKRADAINVLNYDSTEKCIFFSLSSFDEQTGFYSSEFLKVDLFGNVLNRLVDTFGNGIENFQSMGESNDHNYLYWGGIGAEMNLDTIYSVWKLIKTDKNLHVVWKKYYLCGAGDGSISAIVPINNNGDLLLLCNAFTPIDNSWGYPPIPSRIQLKKIDSDGNIISEYYPAPNDYNIPIDMEKMNDGRYLIGGRTFSWGQNNGKPYTLKADVTGNELWHQIYAHESYTTYLLGLAKSKGNIESYYTAGAFIDDSNNSVGYINKIDSYGTEIWIQKIGLQNIADQFFDICASNDDGACAGGSIYFPSEDYARGWITRIDKNGNQKWSHLYTTPHPTDLHDYLFKIITLPDGSFVAGGSSWSLDHNSKWTSDAWLLRVDSNGCSTPNCMGDLAINDVSNSNEVIKIYPNPANGFVTLESSLSFPFNTRVELIDQSGRIIENFPSPEGKSKITYALINIEPGLYFFQIDMIDKKTIFKINVLK